MAKKNEVVKRTPEMIAQAQSRIAEINSEIASALDVASRGYLTIAPLIAEVYDKELYVIAGYKNVDDYARAEHGMSHGTVSGLRKVFNLYGQVDENGSYYIPDDKAEFGYTKLYNFAIHQKDFEHAGIDPITTFDPNASLKSMIEELDTKLEELDRIESENAIDTTATISDASADNTSADNASADNASADNTPASTSENANFMACYNATMEDFAKMKSAYGKMPKGVKALFEKAEQALQDIIRATQN